MATPRVYNKNADRHIPHDAVYVGRGSKWGNPYRIGRDGDRDDVLRKYTKHLLRSGLHFDLDELMGKDLVCFCMPKACHGVILVQLANRVPYDEAASGADVRELRERSRVDGNARDVLVGAWRMPELRGKDLGIPPL